MAIEPDIPLQSRSAFPSDLPPRPSSDNRSFRERNCPNMRTCWHFSFRSYDPRHTPDKSTLFRRLAMIAVLFLRTGMSVLVLVSAIMQMHIAAIVIYAIMGVIGFLFVGWCLAVIGDAAGDRMVFEKLIGRAHLDWFLYALALIHTAIIILWWFALGGLGEGVVWLGLWIVIFAVAWICTWPPEYPPSNV